VGTVQVVLRWGVVCMKYKFKRTMEIIFKILCLMEVVSQLPYSTKEFKPVDLKQF
jgi:hypothetical protein